MSSPDRAPIEVEVVTTQCRECSGLGQQWYTVTTTDYPETCRRCKGLGRDTERRTLAPGSLDEAALMVGRAYLAFIAHDESGTEGDRSDPTFRDRLLLLGERVAIAKTQARAALDQGGRG